MRSARAIGLACLAGAAALLVVAALRGELRGGLFLVVPYFVGTGLAAVGAMLLLVAGLFLLALGSIGPPPAGDPDLERAPAERRTSSGGVVLIGPIPIVWGTGRRILPWMVLAGAVLLVLAIVASLSWGRR